ncbi:MAG TPA: BTAD domain-containing putative transcriptional regulator [Pseudonocardiaceae bacterium]|nr:BTAD domain-containing putative transcriptional regulator [Pseudonocardiaceae bacterium]
MFIRTLGPFQVFRNGTPVPSAEWQSQKAQLLLKILIARRKATSRELLIDLLWPDVPPAKASNRLTVLLWRLRSVLQPHAGAGPLASNGGMVWLDRIHVNVDVEEFLAAATAAFAAHRAGQPNAKAQLMAAVAAYTGDFLEDDAQQDWAIPLAEEVRATHISLLRALAVRLRQSGDIDEAIRCLLGLLRHDPFDEPAHLDLINIQFDAGHLGEARRHYEIYVKLMEEIDVRPQSLFHELRRKQSGPARPILSDGDLA